MKANSTNFYTCTTANFVGTIMPTSEPDYISDSGSKYWYSEEGVTRVSNHWNDHIRTCSWFLNGKECNEEKAGFCKWKDFKLLPLSISFFEYSLDKDYNYTKTKETIIDLDFDMISNNRIKCYDYDIEFLVCGNFESIHKEYDSVDIRLYLK